MPKEGKKRGKSSIKSSSKSIKSKSKKSKSSKKDKQVVDGFDDQSPEPQRARSPRNYAQNETERLPEMNPALPDSKNLNFYKLKDNDVLNNTPFKKSLRFHNELRQSNMLKGDKIDPVQRDELDSSVKIDTADQGMIEGNTEFSNMKDKQFLDDEERERAERFRNIFEEDRETNKQMFKNNKMSELKGEEREAKISDYIKKDLDLKYVNKVLEEILEGAKKYSELDILKEDYRKLVGFVVKQLEK